METSSLTPKTLKTTQIRVNVHRRGKDRGRKEGQEEELPPKSLLKTKHWNQSVRKLQWRRDVTLCINALPEHNSHHINIADIFYPFHLEADDFKLWEIRFHSTSGSIHLQSL